MGACTFTKQEKKTRKIEFLPLSQAEHGLLTQPKRYLLQQFIEVSRLEISSQFQKKLLHTSHRIFEQIEKDAHRTFPNLIMFQKQQNINNLKHILRQFAIYFPQIGYTQGVNFFAGFLLACGYNSRQSFQMLARICTHPHIMAIGLFEDQFPLTKLYVAIFWKLLSKKNPKLNKRLKDSQIPDQSWIFQWLQSYFLHSFPIQISEQFFVYILQNKTFAPVRIALALVITYAKQLEAIQANSEWEYYQFFNSLRSQKDAKIAIKVEKVLKNADKKISQAQIAQAINSLMMQNLKPREKQYLQLLKENNVYIHQNLWQKMNEKWEQNRNNFFGLKFTSNYQRYRPQSQHIDIFALSKIEEYNKSHEKPYDMKFMHLNFIIDTSKKYKSVFETKKIQQLTLQKRATIPICQTEQKNSLIQSVKFANQ